ncbi:efflux RND transporter permease subunit [Haliscomenobacter hydrossis]|uniref:Acriflavin resistance protein n=1 Tax=Haliscomenobacter hydrossis (strain ATCC 27775 / DSM 1100 / LMG 10767 / O) TaxID=760192 RepID=F4L343_HALH1|nr:efflux RND transporter permease subunit [Haliscomenobacter hydrossis]AEE50702.1 acriflavin resistance protein [Haliscomenobacter hydrossis DSM 1100]
MIHYLLQRPIAVLLSFIVLCIFGLIALNLLPISLLPDVDVPQIVVKVSYPNTAAEALEARIIRPLRETLTGIPGLKDIESRSSNHRGIIYLAFEYNTKMDLAYIEVNERIDRLSAQFPRDMPRPQTTRINTSDIPIVRLQVTPKIQEDFVQISDLVDKLIKRRLEQLEGISIVDINGLQQTNIAIEPHREVLQALHVSENDLAQTIQAANLDFGGLSVRDGNYQYFVKVSNGFESIADIGRLPVPTTSGLSVPLAKLATIRSIAEPPSGYHLFNGQPALGITIQKQAASRMNELVPRIQNLVKQFEKDYPQANFALTQDQTYLLNAGINNLYQDLMYGGILAVLVLFLFLGNYASSGLMSLNIPISLIITFALFYVLGISLNIISLSGLALGIGMLIDNSIIVLDSITRKRREGMAMLASCERGISEVVTPVLSQVLTTVAVYAPLILLPGLAGLLVYDQAIALTISLGVSLVVAFILSPLLYKLFLGNKPQSIKEDTRFYLWILAGYHRMIQFIFQRKILFFSITCLFGLLAFWLFPKIPIANLPKVEKRETLVKIDWQTPLSVEENVQRVQKLDRVLASSAVSREAEVGIPQFLLASADQSIQQAQVYYACKNQSEKESLDQKAKAWLQKTYPGASFQFEDASNAFTQLFNASNPYFEIRLRPANGHYNAAILEGLKASMPSFPLPNPQLGLGIAKEPSIKLLVDAEKMALYGVDWNNLQEKFRLLFGHYPITELRKFSGAQQMHFTSEKGKIDDLLQQGITTSHGNTLPIAAFVKYELDEMPKYITADKSGKYVALSLDENSPQIAQAKTKILHWANQHGFTAGFSGNYFEGLQNSHALFKIFLISLLLLYFILALQFENLIQPLLVMLTIPLGVTGALLLLYLQQGALDIMAAIGFVVVLGIIVDDPILKVEVINRLLKLYESSGMSRRQALEKAIHDAGDISLKPLLMTSLTTSLALVPVLFTPGIGSDLQKPMVFVIIGGLTIGTFFTTWFIPLAYWFITKKK